MQNFVYELLLKDQSWQSLLSGLGVTLFIVIASLALGMIAGFLVFLLTYFKSPAVDNAVKGFFNFYALLPTPIRLYIFFYIFFSGNKSLSILAGILAMSFNMCVSFYWLLNTEMDHVDPGEIEATVSMGYKKTDAFLRIFLPQILPSVLANLADTIVGHVSTTSLLGLIYVNDFQSVVDGIKAGSSKVWPMIIFSAIIYVLLCAAFRKLVLAITDVVCKQEKSKEQIELRIKRGRI